MIHRPRLRVFAFLLAAIVATAPSALRAAGPGAPVGVGDAAPDFTLADQNGRRHTLSAERGVRAVVLIFYRGHW